MISKLQLFRLRFILTLLAFYPALISAYTIEGYVFNTQMQPVMDAQVILNEDIYYDITDQNGYFYFELQKPGTYSVEIEHISYKSVHIEDISVNDQSITKLDTIFLEPKYYEGEHVVITASRFKKQVKEIIPTLNKVSKVDIYTRNSKTSAEALREESGVFVQKTNHGGGSAIIRGLSSNQILILVDGIRLNNSTYRLGNHQYLTTVDNNMLNGVEVIHGPLSVLYGSDALGGTINLISDNPDFSQTGEQFNYNLKSRFATADNEKMANLNTQYRSSKIAVSSSFSYKRYGDLSQGKKGPAVLDNLNGKTKQSPTGFDAFDIATRLAYLISSGQELTLNYQLSRQQDVPRYDKYIFDGYNKWLYTPQKRDLLYTSYQNTNGFAFIDYIKTTLSYHIQAEGRETQRTETSDLTKESDKVNTFGFSSIFSSHYSKHFLTYGFDFYSDDISSTASITSFSEKTITDTRGRFPDNSRYSSFGLFIQDEYTIYENFNIVPGIRYSEFVTQFEIDDEPFSGLKEKKYSALTTSAGILYNYNTHHYFSLNIAQGFRAPNMSDLVKFGQSKGKVIEIPNLNVVPEKALSLDLGYKYSGKKFKLQSAIYNMKISDLLASADDTYKGSPVYINKDDTLKVKSRQNTGNAQIYGLECSVKYFLSEKWHIRANMAYTYGQNKTAKEPVGGIPPLFGLIGINWQKTNAQIQAYIRFASNQKRLSADDADDPRIPINGTPGWETFNIRGYYRVTSWLTLNATIENIFNKLYREHGSGVNGPGRNLIFGISISS